MRSQLWVFGQRYEPHFQQCFDGAKGGEGFLVDGGVDLGYQASGCGMRQDRLRCGLKPADFPN